MLHSAIPATSPLLSDRFLLLLVRLSLRLQLLVPLHLHVVLRLVVVDEVAIARAPRHVVHVAEGVDDEDVHEGGQHESADERHVETEQVLHHGGQNGEELSVNDGADDGHKRRGEGSHENEGVHSLHGVERHYGSDNDDSPTEHGEEQQRAVGDVGDAIHLLVVPWVVTQRVNELRFKQQIESTWMPVTVR